MKMITRGLLLLCGLIGLWKITIILFQLPDYILPPPWQVIKTLYFNAGLIAKESVPTLVETLLGLIFGCLLGCAAALAMTCFRGLSLWMLPLLLISQAIPTFAIAPLLVIWFGYGLSSKIITTVIMLFFPVASSFYDGLQRTHPAYLELAQTMEAKRWRTFWHIRIPFALPYFAAGLRVATAIAPIGAVVGEWVGSSKGLGFLMLNANARMQIDLMFAALFVIIMISLTLYFITDKLLHHFITWKM